MTSFKVDDVEPLIDEPWESSSALESLAEKVDELDLEAASSEEVVQRGTSYPLEDGVPMGHGANSFIEAVHFAFEHHLPLRLTPDAVWLCVARGFAIHVNANAEELRSQFVDHEDKEYIEIRRDHFSKGSPDNDWEGCFDEFSDKIAERIGEHNRSLLVSDFSTTGDVEKAASEIVLMDAMSSYFEFGVRTSCGFPRIELAGSVEDWNRIQEKVAALSEFGVSWWTDELAKVLDNIIDSFDDPDVEFWRSFYKETGMSGGPFVSGWINTLFPYLKNAVDDEWVRNQFVASDEREYGRGPYVIDFPEGLSKVDFVWHYLSVEYPMQFVAGFVGVRQHDDLTVEPCIGWGVGDKT